jgi:hypothetical protein
VSAEDQPAVDRATQPPVQCAECLAPVETPAFDVKGSPLCAACADAYYVACAECKRLAPNDEVRVNDGLHYCLECFARTFEASGDGAPENVDALVAEYIAAHAEHKKLSERLDQIKEQIKAAAARRERAGGAVTFRSDQGSVKCSYQTKLKWDPDKVAALEETLGPERFESLFERKVSFTPIKGEVDGYLNSDAGDAKVRDALLDACEKVETPSITVVAKKQP